MNTASDVLTLVSAAFAVGFICHWLISTVHPKGP